VRQRLLLDSSQVSLQLYHDPKILSISVIQEGRWKNAINYTNRLGSKGRLAGSFAKLLHEMWGGDLPYVSPTDFRVTLSLSSVIFLRMKLQKTICYLNMQYNGSDQHDSQEFLSFLLDGLHEDLNRIVATPAWSPTPEQEAELERLPQQIASEQEWRAWQNRNDSLIVDYFQGQFRNQLQCLTCHTVSGICTFRLMLLICVRPRRRIMSSPLFHYPSRTQSTEKSPFKDVWTRFSTPKSWRRTMHG
jgi:ubiquitin C-terminal hydrolase